MMFSWQSTTKRLSLRPSSNFLDFFWFVFLISLFSYLLFQIWWMWSQLLVGRMGKVGDKSVCIASINLGDTRYTRTHAQDTAQHTCRHVRAEGVVALLQAEGLLHLPSVFYSGCQNGEEETERDTWFMAVLSGRGSGTDRFATAALKSLNWMNIKFKICVFSATFNFRDHSEIKPWYL